jgi:hypothetical protein
MSRYSTSASNEGSTHVAFGLLTSAADVAAGTMRAETG